MLMFVPQSEVLGWLVFPLTYVEPVGGGGGETCCAYRRTFFMFKEFPFCSKFPCVCEMQGKIL
jgi:hypothetical protein